MTDWRRAKRLAGLAFAAMVFLCVFVSSREAHNPLRHWVNDKYDVFELANDIIETYNQDESAGDKKFRKNGIKISLLGDQNSIKITKVKDSSSYAMIIGNAREPQGNKLIICYFSAAQAKGLADISPGSFQVICIQGDGHGMNADGKAVLFSNCSLLDLDRVFAESKMPEIKEREEKAAWEKMEKERMKKEFAAKIERREAVRLDCGAGATLDLLRIPAGTFMMGSPESEKGRNDDEQQHQVTISKNFFMGAYEVTQAQYQAVMSRNPSKYKGGNLPVETVSHDDAQEFCKKLSEKTGKEVRLPTEAEWEYACRAGTITPFNTGETLDKNQANIDLNNMGALPVGSFVPNAWGLYDMHGNVWEWCSDWHEDYDINNATDPQGPASGSGRVLRGGSWPYSPGICRSASRLRGPPSSRDGSMGFRIALD